MAAQAIVSTEASKAEKHRSDRPERRTSQICRGNTAGRRLPSQQTKHQGPDQDPERGGEDHLAEPDSFQGKL